WVREFRVNGGFKRDARGSHERDWIMSEEDLAMRLVAWMKSKKRLSVKDVRDYINKELFTEDVKDLERLLSYQVTLPISMKTTHSWMVRLGCVYKRATKSYYTDTHEDPKVKKDRTRYIDEKRRIALRQACWVRVRKDSLTPRELERLNDVKGGDGDDDFYSEVNPCVIGGHECIEFHVDFLRDNGSVEDFDALRAVLGPEGGSLSVRYDAAAAAPCEYNHPADKCKCNRKVRHIGQDESIYKAYAREGREWVIQGVSGMRKKTEGPGLMVSAFQDERNGFGLPLPGDVLAQVNAKRALDDKPALKRSPGVRYLEYGKNKDGYWGYDKFKEQIEDVLDAAECLEPDLQLTVEIDHSSGHTKQREDGLHVSNMNVKYGGKQKVLRDTVVTEDWLGPGEAKMYFADGKWSTKYSEGAEVVDLKLKAGNTQSSTFAEGAPPPFYDWDAPRTDVKVTEGTKEKVKEGFEGKPKGEKQYLWERGWWKEGMSGTKGVADDMNVEKVLQALPDFETERTALQEVVESRGHVLLLSPKCHPEVAGVGIEYSWGFSKKNFRRKFNDEVPKNLHGNVEKSLCSNTELTIGRVRRFARRTRDYCRAYREIRLSEVAINSKEMIEKMRAKQKAHRNIL
ncbi:unnamed protein product, partial [Pylaiella littoralis]